MELVSEPGVRGRKQKPREGWAGGTNAPRPYPPLGPQAPPAEERPQSFFFGGEKIQTPNRWLTMTRATL